VSSSPGNYFLAARCAYQRAAASSDNGLGNGNPFAVTSRSPNSVVSAPGGVESIDALMPLAPGTHLGPYEILAPVGAGGMGEVYKARDTRLKRMVAIKGSQDRFSERFEREAHAVAALNHPNICTLYEGSRRSLRASGDAACRGSS
jgi:serine/threonine protein kinase